VVLDGEPCGVDRVPVTRHEEGVRVTAVPPPTAVEDERLTRTVVGVEVRRYGIVGAVFGFVSGAVTARAGVRVSLVGVLVGKASTIWLGRALFRICSVGQSDTPNFDQRQ
jgi:hypothetical protein